MDDFSSIIAKKVLSDQQSYVTAAHVRLLARSRGIPCTWLGFHTCARLPQPTARLRCPRYCSAAAVMAVMPVRHGFLSDRALRIVQRHQRSFVSRVQHHVAARRIGHLRIITKVLAERKRFFKRKDSFFAKRFSDSALCQCSQCLIVIAAG